MFDLNQSVNGGVCLRAFRPPPAADLDHILSLYNNPRIAPLITERFVIPRGEKLKEEFKEIIDRNSEMFCMIETIPVAMGGEEDRHNHEPRFVGITALWAHMERGQRHANYSIVMLPEFWNQGHGKEITKFMVDHAFLHLNMHRISLEVYEGNDRAAGIYRKCGFIEEGRQRKVRWVNGAWRDTILMGILFEDWEKLRGEEKACTAPGQNAKRVFEEYENRFIESC